ncbi:hypothetical protein [Nonomuraea endophytica]|uniref:hypothetical protein n=1 Tax=Nonomuraea endophytica TaxID=714136 RepID=UPI0037C6B148
MTAPAGHRAEPDHASTGDAGGAVAYGEREQQLVATAADPPSLDPPPAPTAAGKPHPDSEPDNSTQVDLGTPWGQLAAGAVFVLGGGGWLLYRIGGWLWVAIAGGVLLGLAVLVAVVPLAWARLRNRTSSGGGSRTKPTPSWWPFGRGGPGGGGRTSRPATSGGRAGGVRAALGRLLPRPTGRAPKTRAPNANAGGSPSTRSKHDQGGLLRRAARNIRDRVRRRKSGDQGGTKNSGAGGGGQRKPGVVRRAARWLTRRDRTKTPKTPKDKDGKGGASSKDGATSSTKRRRRWWHRPIAAARAWDERLTGGRVARLWRWLRRRFSGQPAAVPEQADDLSSQETEAADADGPQEAPAIPDPESETSPRTTRATAPQGASMTAFSLLTAATELPTAAAAYESDDMMDVKGHLEQLHEVPVMVGNALRVLVERLAADYPIHQDTIEALQRAYESLQPTVESCREVATSFAASHEYEITRRLQPRVNEGKWNHH